MPDNAEKLGNAGDLDRNPPIVLPLDTAAALMRSIERFSDKMDRQPNAVPPPRFTIGEIVAIGMLALTLLGGWGLIDRVNQVNSRVDRAEDHLAAKIDTLGMQITAMDERLSHVEGRLGITSPDQTAPPAKR